MSPSPQEFLDALHAEVRRWGGARWVGARVVDDAIVVLFRQDVVRGGELVQGPIEGTRLQFEEFAAEVLGPGAHRLEDVLGEAASEIVEPHVDGRRIRVSWADGLCAEPAAVLWRPVAVDAATAQEADRPYRMTKTTWQGDSSAR